MSERRDSAFHVQGSGSQPLCLCRCFEALSACLHVSRLTSRVSRLVPPTRLPSDRHTTHVDMAVSRTTRPRLSTKKATPAKKLKYESTQSLTQTPSCSLSWRSVRCYTRSICALCPRTDSSRSRSRSLAAIAGHAVARVHSADQVRDAWGGEEQSEGGGECEEIWEGGGCSRGAGCGGRDEREAECQAEREAECQAEDRFFAAGWSRGEQFSGYGAVV